MISVIGTLQCVLAPRLRAPSASPPDRAGKASCGSQGAPRAGAKHEGVDNRSGGVRAPTPSFAREGHDRRAAGFATDGHPAKADGFTRPPFAHPMLAQIKQRAASARWKRQPRARRARRRKLPASEAR